MKLGKLNIISFSDYVRKYYENELKEMDRCKDLNMLCDYNMTRLLHYNGYLSSE